MRGIGDAVWGTIHLPRQRLLQARNRAQRLAEGLDMDETTWGQLVGAAEDTGVDPSVIEAATP